MDKNKIENEIDKNAEELQNKKDAVLAEIMGLYNDSPAEEAADADDAAKDFEDVNAAPEMETAEEAASSASFEDDLEADDPEPVRPAAPLPKYGDGFKFVPIVSVVTVIAVILGHIRPITNGIPSSATVRYIYIGFGVLFFTFGIKLIVDATVNSYINENLQLGKLVTTGIYSKTRNPIYAGVIFMCTGILFASGNAFMYVLPIIYWFFLTELMKSTEEVLLKKRFGEEYAEYCRNTYRIFPMKKSS